MRSKEGNDEFHEHPVSLSELNESWGLLEIQIKRIEVSWEGDAPTSVPRIRGTLRTAAVNVRLRGVGLIGIVLVVSLLVRSI